MGGNHGTFNLIRVPTDQLSHRVFTICRCELQPSAGKSKKRGHHALNNTDLSKKKYPAAKLPLGIIIKKTFIFMEIIIWLQTYHMLLHYLDLSGRKKVVQGWLTNHYLQKLNLAACQKHKNLSTVAHIWNNFELNKPQIFTQPAGMRVQEFV